MCSIHTFVVQEVIQKEERTAAVVASDDENNQHMFIRSNTNEVIYRVYGVHKCYTLLVYVSII